MSHELRTPLIGIIGFSELLAADTGSPLAPDQARSAKIIHDSGMHLKGLIDDILDISIIESERIDVQPEELSFHEVLAEALDIVQPMAAQKGVELLNMACQGGGIPGCSGSSAPAAGRAEPFDERHQGHPRRRACRRRPGGFGRHCSAGGQR